MLPSQPWSRAALFAPVLISLVGMSSCRDRKPAPDQAPLPTVAATWSTAVDTTTPIPGWINQFNDPRLTELVREAIAANHDLAVAAARVEMAQAETRIAGSDRYPQVNATAGANRSRLSPSGNEIDSFSVGVAASWELDIWGRLRQRAKASDATLTAVEADRTAAEQSLAGQVARAWYAARSARSEVATAEALAKTQSESVSIAERRFREGLLDAESVRELRSAQANAENRSVAARITADTRIRQLEILLGRYPSGMLSCPDSLPTVPPPPPAGLPADILARRPDIQAAEWRYRSSLSRANAAQADLYPRLSLTASGGRSSADLSDVMQADFTTWSLGANLLQPIFQGGKLRANRDRADAEARLTGEQFAQTVLRALGEVETRLVTGSLLAERAVQQTKILAESQELEARAQRQYTTGIGEALGVLAARRGRQEAELNTLTIHQLRLENRVDLYIALGGDALPPADSPADAPADTANGATPAAPEMTPSP